LAEVDGRHFKPGQLEEIEQSLPLLLAVGIQKTNLKTLPDLLVQNSFVIRRQRRRKRRGMRQFSKLGEPARLSPLVSLEPDTIDDGCLDGAVNHVIQGIFNVLGRRDFGEEAFQRLALGLAEMLNKQPEMTLACAAEGERLALKSGKIRRLAVPPNHDVSITIV